VEKAFKIPLCKKPGKNPLMQKVEEFIIFFLSRNPANKKKKKIDELNKTMKKLYEKERERE
jgi:hypothetical protein